MIGATYALSALGFGTVVAVIGTVLTGEIKKRDTLVIALQIVGALFVGVLLFLILNPDIVNTFFCETNNFIGARTDDGGSQACRP